MSIRAARSFDVVGEKHQISDVLVHRLVEHGLMVGDAVSQVMYPDHDLFEFGTATQTDGTQ